MKEQTMAVQRMQEYIEVHLSEEITLGNLAEVSFYSPWHSYRIFRDYLGMTPAEYMRRFRLSRSAMKLRAGNQKVIDVAADLGYASVDGFQRAFYREFGCNPKEYARTKVPLPLFIPYGVKFRELRKYWIWKICKMSLCSSCESPEGRLSSSGAYRQKIISIIVQK